MPRSDKTSEIVVVYCPETGKVIKHKRIYGKKGAEANDNKTAVGRTYSPATRKHHKGDDFKVKKERHSS